LLIAFGWCGFVIDAESAEDAAAFRIVKSVPLGGSDKWDYLSFDQGTRRVYVAHDSEITVLDGMSGTIVGRVEGLNKAHGVAIVGRLRRGYATNNGGVTVFDVDNFRHLAEIVTGVGADAVLYDPSSDRVFVMNGKGHSVTAIDPDTNSVIKTIGVGGKPESAAVDGRGTAFINVEDTSEIVRLETTAVAVTARWAIPQCEAPHGLAIDSQRHRLFASCVNAKMAVVDATSGAIKEMLPIGKGSDAVVFDPKPGVAFSSNGDGTLSMIAESSEEGLSVLPPVRTSPGARTMTLDRQSGRIFLVAGDADSTGKSIVSGSLKLMILESR
jgi:YVTN family beta-propeller protein